MYQFLITNNAMIRYRDLGSGTTVVLLHGYLETLDIWNDFAKDLAGTFRVISIDHMGHGGTRADKDVFTAEYSAELIRDLMEYLNVPDAVFVGHSMGGYPMLAMEELFPEKVKAMVFFHSISWADSDEKKQNRDREIGMIVNGKRRVLFGINISRGFADDNQEKFKGELARAKQIAAQSSDAGIIAALKGMKVRKDRTFVVEQTGKPVLFIIGKKDNYIPPEKLIDLSRKAQKGSVVVLENTGHMGFVEEKEKSLESISSFIKSL